MRLQVMRSMLQSTSWMSINYERDSRLKLAQKHRPRLNDLLCGVLSSMVVTPFGCPMTLNPCDEANS